MSKIIIIGAGGVGRVTAYKCAENSDVFSKIILASRTKAKCDVIAKDISNDLGVTIETAQVDAVEAIIKQLNEHRRKKCEKKWLSGLLVK